MNQSAGDRASRGVSVWWRAVALGLAGAFIVDGYLRLTRRADVVIPVDGTTMKRTDPRMFVTLPEKAFEQVPAATVAAWLERESGMPVVLPVDPAIGQAVVSVKFERGTSSSDLYAFVQAINRQSGASPVVQIETETGVEIAPERASVVLKMYDVRRLAETIQKSLPPEAYQNPLNFQQASRSIVEDVMSEIRRVITDTVDAASWKENGGDMGFMTSFGGLLLIEQTEANQRKIEALLAKLDRGT